MSKLFRPGKVQFRHSFDKRIFSSQVSRVLSPFGFKPAYIIYNPRFTKNLFRRTKDQIPKTEKTGVYSLILAANVVLLIQGRLAAPLMFASMNTFMLSSKNNLKKSASCY